MGKSSTALVVMNVHKESESIDVAIADENEARHYGRVGGEAGSLWLPELASLLASCRNGSMPLICVIAILSCFSNSASAATLTVCNKLDENLNDLQFLSDAATAVEPSSGPLKPGACTRWSVKRDGAYTIRYILGEGKRVMLCSVTAQVFGSARLEISASTEAACIR